MTNLLKVYAVFCVLWSIAFFSLLHWALFDQESRWPFIVAGAIIYGIGFGMMGAFIGRFDDERKSRHGLEKVYTLTGNSISFLVGGLWILIFRGQHWWELLIATLCLAISTALILASFHGRIKGIKKDQLFK